MNRVMFSVGPVSIYWYSFLILIGVLIGYEIAIHYSKKINYHSMEITDMILYIVIWGIVGARLYYVLFNFSMFSDDLIGIFQIWRGGLAIYGAVLGASSYILYYCLKRKLSFIKVMDIFSLSLLLGQAIGRWGNFFNQEAYGGITTFEALSSLHIPDFIIRGMYIDGVYRQPTFLYESLWCFVGVIFISFIRKKYSNQEGKQISFYLMWYGFGRFFIEGFRADSLYIGPIRVSQMLSAVLFIVGLVYFVYIWKKNHIKITNVNNINGRI